MTKQEWLGIMSLADDKYVEEADPTRAKPKSKLSWKKITAIAASVCIFATILFVSVFIQSNNPSDKNDNVSGGFIVNSSPSSELYHCFCAYKFQNGSYDKSNVIFDYYYAIDEQVYDMRLNGELSDMQSEHGKITDYRIYVTAQNYDTVNNLLLNDKIPYSQLLKETNAGETKNGIFVNDIITINENFSFNKFAINSYRDNGNIIREFSYFETVSLPEELFVNGSGTINIDLIEYTTYADGETNICCVYPVVLFEYRVNGNRVNIYSKS